MIKPKMNGWLKLAALISAIVCLSALIMINNGSSNPKDDMDVKMNSESPPQSPTAANRLIDEKSPYLLQHAHNPVDWYPWGEAAFAKAKNENKPIFLSIGYSTCHWCHVMEHESFENPEIAAILNQHFVAVKVDREERPDVDKIYMTFVQATTGSGGWPMSVWLTPDLKPFYGGTYYPPEDRWGCPGFASILNNLAQAWKNKQQEIIASGNDIAEQLRRHTAIVPDSEFPFTLALTDKLYRSLKSEFDSTHGGFGGAPKFPRPAVYEFLFHYYARTGEKPALEMNLQTLRKMAAGGIHDHLGGGFHRYSVDERWHVPHFEKMLYDQAQLVWSYVAAWQITKDQFFATMIDDILGYVLRDLTGADGQFYSAEDADSPLPEEPTRKGEGAFYVWEAGEIATILDPESTAIVNTLYGIEKNGNVANDPHQEFVSKNILFIASDPAAIAKKLSLSPAQVEDKRQAANEKLLAVRNRRPRPFLDDKTLTAWNGMMISAYAQASRGLDNIRYLEVGERAAQFIKKHLWDEDKLRLLRRYRSGDSAITAYVDDYVYLIQALLDLYEAGFNFAYLQWAINLQEVQDQHYWDPEHGGYFNVMADNPHLLMRMKEDYDGAEPAPNSIALANLGRLFLITKNAEYRQKADKVLVAYSSRLRQAPQVLPQMVAASEWLLSKTRQIFIAGDPQSTATKALVKLVNQKYLPNTVVFIIDPKQKYEAPFDGEFLKTMVMIDNRPTVYICENFACKLPTNDPAIVARMLE